MIDRLGLLLFALSLAAGCDATYHARLNDGAGLGEGDPVVVSGVRVGQVDAVRVMEGQVDVELSIEDEHEVTLRTDACAMAVPQEGRPTLVIAPGTGAPLEEERPIPQCEIGGQLDDLMRGLGQGLGQMLEQLGQGLLGGGGAGGSGGGGSSPFPFPLPSPSNPSPSNPSPSNPAPSDPPPPPGASAGSAGCDAIRIRVDAIESVPATPLLLSDGGHRAWLVFDNDGDRPMEIGPLSEATFSEPGGRALHPARMPSEGQGWFMPFTVPAHGSARRSVVFEGRAAPLLDRVEARRSAPAGAPLDDCVVTQAGLAGPISI